MKKLFTLLTMLIVAISASAGTITAAATTDLGSGNTPRYVVEADGVGRLMKNKTGSSSWALSNTSYLQTSGSMFALQTYNEISSIIIKGYGKDSSRSFSKLEVGTTTSNYAEVSATGEGTMSSTAGHTETITITPSTAIAENSYVAITFSGNINIYSVELVEAQESTESPSITSNLNIKYNTIVNGVLPLSIETENAYSYQWYINNTASTEGAEAIEGATKATYNYTASEEGTKYIYCVATNDNATGEKNVRSTIAAVKATAAAAATISWDFGTTAPSGNAFPTVAYSAESDKFDSSTSALGENVAYDGTNYDHCLLNDEGEDEENVYVVRVKPSATTNNEITFTVNVKEGYTFTPASVSFVAMKQGTNGDVTIDAQWFAEGQENIALASGVKLKRASSSNVYATPGGDRLSYAVNGSASTGACGLKLILNTKDKAYGIGEIKIVGYVSETVTTETITTEDGVATYVTENALDFTGLATKAYVVTGTNSAKTKVLTEEVTTVPAGTALLVKLPTCLGFLTAQ